jgi:hypothetical protein
MILLAQKRLTGLLRFFLLAVHPVFAVVHLLFGVFRLQPLTIR